MTFVSYAQNYEDVILRRVLGDVDKGCYIDVGANDPVIDSVTKTFYDSGWRGINIEPVSDWYENLLKDRPEDINLQLAVGDSEAEADFYEVVGTGLSTMDESTAERHAKEHGYQVKNYKVPVVTLSAVLQEYPCPDIHFLKIDVEGAEKSVLEGLDLGEIRPWVILIESTLPNSIIQNYEEWEFILLAADYEFVYFDGLNRFYVAREHPKIKTRLAIPPNVFDDFVLSGLSSSSLHKQIATTKTQLEVAHSRQIGELHTQVDEMYVQAESANAELARRDEWLQNKETQLQEVSRKLTDYEKQMKVARTELACRDERLRDKEAQLREVNKTLTDYEKQFAADQIELTRRDNLLQDNETQLQEVAKALKDHERQVNLLHQTNLHWKRETDRLNTELRAVYNSKSWRITLPLRILWKPFESRQSSVTSKSAIGSSVTPGAIDTHIKPEPMLQVPQEAEELSVDEILKRIRTELKATGTGKTE